MDKYRIENVVCYPFRTAILVDKGTIEGQIGEGCLVGNHGDGGSGLGYGGAGGDGHGVGAAGEGGPGGHAGGHGHGHGGAGAGVLGGRADK